MQKSNVLRLVDSQVYYENNVELVKSNNVTTHSLHNSIMYQNKLNPNIASFFIEKYSKVGEIVLDPFCGFGTIPLETNLKKRISYASDINKLFLKITKAKLNPITFSNLAMVLQSIDTKRLVKLGNYEKYFAPFFDIDTYKEILSIKEYIAKNKDNVSCYIEFLLASILHGPNSTFCSTPTYQEFSITPKEQHQINVNKRISPEYRPVISRLLRKASFNEQDLFPSFLEDLQDQNKIYLTDARNLNYIAFPSIDLILTEPPLFFDKCKKIDYWLKNWFCDVDDLRTEDTEVFDLNSWLDFMNEALMEFVRILKPTKRIVLILRDFDKHNKNLLHKALVELVNKNLSRYLLPEKCLIEERKAHSDALNLEKQQLREKLQYKYLVLKRL